ncbi:hypothetical protein ACWCQQ_39095 [Streptomyces sp. NPDC002143]
MSHRVPALRARPDRRQDASRARTGSLPQALATLRSLEISLAHLAGWTNNATAHDQYRNHPTDALRELGLTR